MICKRILICVLLCAHLIVIAGKVSERTFIRVRGHPKLQRLPISHTRNWNIWTLNQNNILESVPTHLSSETDSWCDPTTFNNIYMPKDLPSPLCRPALGVAIVGGVARYVMPSIVLELNTADRVWRNRGLCSLPRSDAWIDLFAEYTPPMSLIKYTCFGSDMENNPRFLEDQDGNSAWYDLISINKNLGVLPRDIEDTYASTISITPYYERIQAFLKNSLDTPLHEGYHFVDIPFEVTPWKRFPRSRITAFLSDFDDTRQLLEIEENQLEHQDGLLDQEPCAELRLQVIQVGAGRDSPYLPEVYKNLYEEGSILDK